MSNNVWTIPKSIIKIGYGSFIPVVFFILFIDLTEITSNQYYSSGTIFLFLVSTVLIYLIALENSVISFIISFVLTTAYTQRFIITYFYPQNIDFTDLLDFTQNELFYIILYYTSSVFFIFLGLYFSRYFNGIKFSKSIKISNFKAQDFEFINLLFFRFRTISFLKTIVFTYVFFVFIKFLILITTGIGFTGATHSAQESFFHWLASRSGTISSYAFFSVLLLNQYDKKSKLYKYFLFFFIFDSVLAASRALFLGFAQTIVICFYVFKKSIKTKYIVYSVIFIGLFGGGYYVALTTLRGYLTNGEININSADIFLTISAAFSQMDSLFLWVDMPKELYENSIGFFSDLAALVNGLVIGDVIPVPDRINLGKLMVQYGRLPGFNIFDLGGHGENPGTFAITYIYLGFYGSMVYWFLHGFLLNILNKSEIHMFWKYALVLTYGFGPSYFLYTQFSLLIQPIVLIIIIFVFYEIIRLILGNHRIYKKSKLFKG